MIVLTSNGASSTDNFFETAAVSVSGTDYLTPTPGSTTPSGVTIQGTTVTLTGTDEFGHSVSDTTTTDANGNYSFTGLNPSDSSGYTVTETPPATDTHVGQTSTTSGAVTNTPPGTPAVVSNIVLMTNGASSTDNFFETAAVSVSGTDYLTPTPGSTTPSTLTIAGTTVTLTGTDDFGHSVSATTTTDANGNYSFTGLNPSNAAGYTVTETPPASDSHVGQTSTTSGANAGSDATVSMIVLTSNGASSTDNFFETAAVSVSGTDYLTPTPGSTTPSTVTIAGTTVTLTGTDDFGNAVSETTTTNGSGFYSFTGLNPSNSGGYTVTETPPASDSHVGQTSTTTGAVTNTPPGTPSAVSMIVLTSNGASSTDNFFETAAVSINGYDYLTPTPGSTTPSTVTIAGTTVTLTGTDDFGNAVSETTTTNGSGFYSFTGLNPSNAAGYTVTETPPASDSHVGQTSTTTGADTNTPPGTPAVVSMIVLTSNGASSTDNFFETAAVSVSGTDYLVPNTTTAGDLTTSTTGVAIAGTSVTLTGTDEFGNPVSETTTTNASGNYSFMDLNPSNGGGYTVTETPPAADTHVGQTSTTAGAMTNTPPGTPSAVSMIVLTTNGASSTDNFFEATQPNLTITKTADQASILAGQTAGFTVTITNIGAVTDNGVTLSDPLPAGTGGDVFWTIDSTTGNPGDFQITGSTGSQVLSLTISTLTAGESIAVHLTSPTDGADTSASTFMGTLPNTATVMAPNPAGGETSESASATITINAPDVDVLKTADAATVLAGNLVGFTVKVSNDSTTAAASGIVLSDNLPSVAGGDIHWTIAAGSDATDFVITGADGSQVLSLTAAGGALGINSSESVHIVSATTGIDVSGATFSSTLNNTATVTTPGHQQAGGDTGDTSSASTSIVAPDVDVLKTADAATITAGGTAGFTVKVFNESTTAGATGIVLSDPLPAGAGSDVFWTIDASVGNPSDFQITGAIGHQVLSLTAAGQSLGAGASESVHLTSPTDGADASAVTFTGTLPNTATVTAPNQAGGDTERHVQRHHHHQRPRRGRAQDGGRGHDHRGRHGRLHGQGVQREHHGRRHQYRAQ